MCKNEEERIDTFEDALRLIFSNTVPKGVVLVEVGAEEESEEDVREMDGREEVFALMTDKELEAFDLVENFAFTPKAGLPEDDDSLEARIEHAEWNAEDLHDDVANILAEFEATVAYYATRKAIDPDDESICELWLEEIQDCINDIVDIAREIELLIRSEVAAFRADQASVALDEALLDREIIGKMLEEYYEQ